MDVRWGEQKEVDRKRRKTIDDIMVAGGRELIDTLWNVNDFYAACQYWFQGMN